MPRLIMLILTLILSSCSNSNQTEQRVNVDTALTIPKNLAVEYLNQFKLRNFDKFPNQYFHADFKENSVKINRDSIPFEADAINNEVYNYTDLILVAEIITITGMVNVQKYSLGIIHKDELHSPDLYRYLGRLNANYLTPEKLLYAWEAETKIIPLKDFQKALSALTSLGVQVPKKNPREIYLENKK